MSADFYRAFEDKYRGSRELVKQRLEVYLPFLSPFNFHTRQPKGLDLGCGRGEWLELLSDNHFTVEGVDLDDGMLEACRARNLSVHTGDALTFLRGLADNSLAVLSAFHLVEHLPFAALQDMLAEARRVLEPGGLLIMETPNPENLVVGSCLFYMDPTHLRPIPPDLLLFMTEHLGFYRSKVVRLQESPGLLANGASSLLSVLSGVSPDYAVIAQKQAPPDFLALFDKAFNVKLGVCLGDLAARFQDQLMEIQSEAHQARMLSEQLFAHAQGLEDRLAAVLTSSSWKITAPLRWINTQCHLLKNEGFRGRFKALVKKIVRKANALLLKAPRLRSILISLIKRLGLYRFLKLAQQRISISNGQPSLHPAAHEACADLGMLTPRAQAIVATLKQRIASRENGGAS